jgi:hypothetical protein
MPAEPEGFIQPPMIDIGIIIVLGSPVGQSNRFPSAQTP